MNARDLLAMSLRLSGEGVEHAWVTVVRTAGSTPRKAGAKMLVTRSASFGTIGGGRIEQELLGEARAALDDGAPRLVTRHLGHDLAMCCGGEMQSFIEPVVVPEVLVLVGAGHIHRALAPIAVSLGFDVTVADDLDELLTEERFPDARRAGSFAPSEWGVRLDARAHVVVATRDHAVDEDVLLALGRLERTLAYVGVIGSLAKVARFKKRLEARGVSSGFVERLRGPVGVDVGAETPEEIAVSIAAELVALRRRP